MIPVMEPNRLGKRLLLREFQVPPSLGHHNNYYILDRVGMLTEPPPSMHKQHQLSGQLTENGATCNRGVDLT